MEKQEKSTVNYFGGFVAMVFLFFIIGFLTTANTQFQVPLKDLFLSEGGSLRNTLTTLITFSWFLAYPVFGVVGSRIVDNHGYKATLLTGLIMMFIGLGFFWLSSWTSIQFPDSHATFGDAVVPLGYFMFLIGSFIVGGSATVLQVVINPYLSACNVKGTRDIQRMAIGGTANSLGTTAAPYFVSGIVFSGLAMQDVNIGQLQKPFIGLMAVVLVLIISMAVYKLPDISNAHAKKGETLERSVWSFRHLRLGVVAIFFYVGCEVCVGGNINLYVVDDLGMDTNTAMLMATLYWGGLLVGRLASSLTNKISPRTQLTFTTVCAIFLVTLAISTGNPWLLVAVGLCHSIMWGAIYTLAIKGLGKYTSVATGVFMTGVLGGAIFPLLQGAIADASHVWRWSWLLVLVGEVVMLLYAQVGSRTKDTVA